MLGGYAGGQAELVRVPFADGPIKIEDGLTDEQVLFLSDIFPDRLHARTVRYQAGRVIAVWGAGPVGQFAIARAFLLGAERVIAIDRFPYRLRMALERAGAEIINYEETDVREALMEMTAGRGPDACIDAVGMEAHHHSSPLHAYDRAKQAARLETDRPHALRQAIMSCRNGGTVSVMGVYGGFIDKFPMGSLMNRSLTIRTGQCHVHRSPPAARPDPERRNRSSFVITHRMRLGDAPHGYDIFNNKKEQCVKVFLKP
jgi:threonine dehydrogenase-like Zn-dependent dehydrogenase